MRRLARSGIITWMVVLAAPLGAQAPTLEPLPDSVVDAAIRVGLSTKEEHVFDAGEAAHGFAGAMLRQAAPSYALYLQGPVARIQSFAAANAKKYMPYTRDSVTDSLRLPFFAVNVVPGNPRMIAGEMMQAAPVEHVVLRQRGKDADGNPYPVIQPVLMKRSPVQWSNALGGTYSGESVLALFDARQIPDADIDVIVVNSGPEFKVRVKRDELASVR